MPRPLLLRGILLRGDRRVPRNHGQNVSVIGTLGLQGVVAGLRVEGGRSPLTSSYTGSWSRPYSQVYRRQNKRINKHKKSNYYF